MIALIVLVAVGLLAVVIVILWAAGTPCPGCEQPAIDCRCPVHPGERVELALLAGATDPDFVATQAAHLDESVDEWAERTGGQPTLPHRPAVTTLPLPAPRKEAS